MEHKTKQRVRTKMASSCPRYCSMLKAAKMIMIAAIGTIICAASASQWQHQYATLLMPLTICRCLLLLRRSYTGKTTTDAVRIDAPITMNRDVMNVVSLLLSTTSPSTNRFTSGSHSFDTDMPT